MYSIYAIKSKQDNSPIYIGSTTNSLNKRWIEHKSHCKIFSTPIYKYILSNGGVDNFYIELYEAFETDQTDAKIIRYELLKREGEIIRRLKNTEGISILNNNIPCRDFKQYYLDNRNKFKQYYQDHKEEKKNSVKKYYIDNREKIRAYQSEYYKRCKINTKGDMKK